MLNDTALFLYYYNTNTKFDMLYLLLIVIDFIYNDNMTSTRVLVWGNNQ